MTETTETFYAEAGRRRTIHRGVTVDGVEHIGTERCNLDDADFPPHRVPVGSFFDQTRLCGWCFPKVVPE